MDYNYFCANLIFFLLMRIHFIAVGGAIMHQLAIELQRNGHHITGSDDEIFEPAYSNLQSYRLLPDRMGWDPGKLNDAIDAVILGMHAREDNPELVRAKELGLNIYSFPEYIYEYSKHKQRVVVAGSHGKTSTTSMIMHVLQKQNIAFDYLVGARVEGFDRSVRLSDAPLIILEGDEYPASVIEKRPKIHFYHPHISILTGIEWDHINVFPTYEHYVEQFAIYLRQMAVDKATLVYCNADAEVVSLVRREGTQLDKIPYETPSYKIENDQVIVIEEAREYGIRVFGAHNLQNMEAARIVCNQLGVSNEAFYTAAADFSGAARRLEKIRESEQMVAFRDFAHAPSKVRATIQAVRERYPDHWLIACLELHTFSSLNEKFHSEYKDTLQSADAASVYFSEHALQLKRLPLLDAGKLKTSFNQPLLDIFSKNEALKDWIQDEIKHADKPVCLLLMSSGTYDGLDLQQLFPDH